MKKERTQPEGKIRVMIVDDHPVMRDALRVIINSEPDLTVAAEADGGEGAIESLETVRPDVVLMDGSMPDMSGMEASQQLRKIQPDLKIIGLSLFQDSSYLEEMISVGAKGYILKTATPSDILNAIRTVAAGGTSFDSSIARFSTPEAAPAPASSEELSADELTVARLLADGRTNAEIAASSGFTGAEVAAHRAAVMRKLGVRNRAELRRIAPERLRRGRKG